MSARTWLTAPAATPSTAATESPARWSHAEAPAGRHGRESRASGVPSRVRVVCGSRGVAAGCQLSTAAGCRAPGAAAAARRRRATLATRTSELQQQAPDEWVAARRRQGRRRVPTAGVAVSLPPRARRCAAAVYAAASRQHACAGAAARAPRGSGRARAPPGAAAHKRGAPARATHHDAPASAAATPRAAPAARIWAASGWRCGAAAHGGGVRERSAALTAAVCLCRGIQPYSSAMRRWRPERAPYLCRSCLWSAPPRRW